MSKPSTIRKSLLNIINDCDTNPDAFVVSKGKDMSRHRKLPLSKTISTILSFENHSLNKELFNYFSDNLKSLPSKSALVQQRDKINEHLFPYILRAFNAAYPFKKTFKGYHLIACDGSDLNLPTNATDKQNFVKYAHSDDGYYQFHLNATFDILEKRFCDIFVQPRPLMNEAKALLSMINDFPNENNYVFIADRGYPSFNLIASIANKDKFYLFRTKSPTSSGSLLKKFNLPDSDSFDVNVSFGLTRSHKKKYTKHPDKFKILRPDRTVDIIDIDDMDTVVDVNMRVICFVLPSGIKEYLITNLPHSITYEDIKQLYNLRWGIETAFKSLKYAFALVYFHSVRRDFIIQEIYARLIMYNFASLIATYVSRTGKFKKILQAREKNWKVSMDYVSMLVSKFMSNKFPQNCMINLILSNMSQIRDNSLPKKRKVRSQSVKPLNYRS